LPMGLSWASAAGSIAGGRKAMPPEQMILAQVAAYLHADVREVAESRWRSLLGRRRPDDLAAGFVAGP